MANSRGRLRIGTSGWIYRHWRGLFYPPKLPARRWFESYAQHFDTVEINNSFYRLPSEAAFEQWKQQAPPGFLYAVKASRFLTHMKKLRDPADSLDRILSGARLLGDRLGPVLYQLPPYWKCNLPRLEEFVALLPHDLIHVFEFRDPSWYNDDVRHVLSEHDLGFCIHDLRGSGSPCWVTGRAVYMRFHGPTEKAYAGCYRPSQLERSAEQIHGYLDHGHDVYAYFNNDDRAYAVSNALALRDLLTAQRLQS